MTDHYTPWLKSTGRVAAGAMLMIVAGIAVYGTKQWVGLVFVVIGAVSVGMGLRAIRQRRRDQPADSRPSDSQPSDSRSANGQPSNSQPGP
jgi:hypothetical protein